MTKKREKEASRALLSMPGETLRTDLDSMVRSSNSIRIESKSLAKLTNEYRSWVEKQPEWIMRRYDLIQDRFSDSLSDIDLDLAVQDRLVSDLRLIQAGRIDDLQPLFMPGSKEPRTFNSHIKGHSRPQWLSHKHTHSHYDRTQTFPSKPGHPHEHDERKPMKKSRRKAIVFQPKGGRNYYSPRAGYRIVSPGTYRIFDNKRFIIDDQYTNKSQARMMAGFWRNENFNARVIPTRKGYAVYVRKR